LEVIENIHTAVSANPDNTDNDEAVIQALQHVLNQKIKKQVQFDRVKMPVRKEKAPESILKHLDQVGAAKKNQSSTAGPSAPASRTTISAPVTTTSAIESIATSNTSGPQYCYSTPVENPTVILKVVNHALHLHHPVRTALHLTRGMEAVQGTHHDTAVRATLIVLMNNSSLKIYSGEIQSKYINNVQHLPSQGKYKENTLRIPG
jgi:hypothetical protein